MQLTTHKGRRCSAATAFLSPVLSDKRLTVKTGATVTQLLFEGDRCIGVEYSQNGQLTKVHAASEVVLTSGSYVSPKLLMLSGIGPEEQLARHGIETRVNLPGVGQNLQDHHEVPVSAYTKGKYGYYGEERGAKMLVNGVQYLLFGSGPVASNGAETCAFVNPETRGPDSNVKIYCVAMIYLDRDVADVQPDHGVTFTCCLMRPKARGTVRLRSADPFARTLIDPNFLGHPEDLRIEIAALRYAREILCVAADEPHGVARSAARSWPADRRGADRILPAHGEDQLPSGGHLRDGRRQQPDGGGDAGPQGARRREPQDLRRIDHAQPDQCQHQRPDDGDRRQGGWVDDGRGAASACGDLSERNGFASRARGGRDNRGRKFQP